MAIHSSVLAWRSPWTEPGRFPVQGIAGAGHSLVTKLPSRPPAATAGVTGMIAQREQKSQ